MSKYFRLRSEVKFYNLTCDDVESNVSLKQIYKIMSGKATAPQEVVEALYKKMKIAAELSNDQFVRDTAALAVSLYESKHL